MKRIIKIVWLAVAAGFAAFLAAPLDPGKDERWIGFVYGMTMLTFPTGAVLFVLAEIGAWFLPLPFQSSRVGVVAIGSIFVLPDTFSGSFGFPDSGERGRNGGNLQRLPSSWIAARSPKRTKAIGADGFPNPEHLQHPEHTRFLVDWMFHLFRLFRL